MASNAVTEMIRTTDVTRNLQRLRPGCTMGNRVSFGCHVRLHLLFVCHTTAFCGVKVQASGRVAETIRAQTERTVGCLLQTSLKWVTFQCQLNNKLANQSGYQPHWYWFTPVILSGCSADGHYPEYPPPPNPQKIFNQDIVRGSLGWTLSGVPPPHTHTQRKFSTWILSVEPLAGHCPRQICPRQKNRKFSTWTCIVCITLS